MSEADATIAAVRDALENNEITTARDRFVTLPGLAHHYHQWLHDVLRDLYTTGRIEVSSALAFVSKLPDPKWALAGCSVLQRAKKQFEWEKTPAIQLPCIALASLVQQLWGELTGDDRIQAETYWHEWFCPTVHAIILGRPVVLESSARHEVLYSVSNASAFDWDRRYVFGWRQPWTPKLVEKEQWLLVPVDDTWETFYIESAAFGEYLYAETHMTVRPDDDGNVRRRVFSWRNNSERLEASDPRAHWQLLPVDGRRTGEFRLYNKATHAYLCSPDYVFDDERRQVICAATSPQESDRVWRVLPQRLTAVDKGAAAFFGARYEDAVPHLTRALDDDDDFLEPHERLKCLVLRATSLLRLGHEMVQVRKDMDALATLGGDKAVRTIGLYPLWRECAVALGEPCLNDEPPTPSSLLVSLRELVDQGDQLFVVGEYEKALAAYDMTACLGIDPSDVLLRARRVDADVCRVKCLYVLDRADEALVILDALDSWIHQKVVAVGVRDDIPVHITLWRARCQRKLYQFKDAAETLARALDAIACCSLPTQKTAWLEQSIQLELDVVHIFESQLVETLLRDKPEPQPEPADSMAEQLVHSFRCPLSFEFMRDPVMAPSGTTYEREMIEWHLDAVGAWDPMTRKELFKSQLYPNRTLKVLIETMLSEHKLGRLLAACNS